MDVSLPAQLGARQPHAATLVDLSASGCLARCPQRLAAGQVLDLAFELDGRPVRGKVRVADVSLDGDAPATEYLVGLEFVKPPMLAVRPDVGVRGRRAQTEFAASASSSDGSEP